MTDTIRRVQMQQELLYPLVITLDTDGGACVSGCTEDGVWFRPEPVTREQVLGDDPLYQYFRPVLVGLTPSRHDDARPEDRYIERPGSAAGETLSDFDREALLNRVSDPTVDEAFRDGRSAAVVQVRIIGIRPLRSTGGKSFIRMRFTDATGEVFDWIVRDVTMLTAFPDVSDPTTAAELEQLSQWVAGGPRMISIGLTKPNNRQERFGGCQPLVVGLHGIDEDIATIRGRR